MSEIVLGFDFGLARIGVATGQTLTKTATPLTILRAQQGQPDWTRVEQLVRSGIPIASSLGCHSIWTNQSGHLLSYPANLRAALKVGSADPRTN